MKKRRAYHQTVRAARAAETQERILDAAERLLRDVAVSEVTIGRVAERAGVSGQTVYRLYRDKAGLFDALAARIGARVEAQRGDPPPGDVPTALQMLLEHYEAEGDLIARLVQQEHLDPWVREGIARGRAYHRAWVERVFGTALSGSRGGARDRLIDGLVVATDLSTWRLLRRELGRSPERTHAVMLDLAEGLIRTYREEEG